MSERYLKLIEPTLPGTRGLDFSQPFDVLGVDSFDLLTIRVEFERALGAEIPDSRWTRFRSFDDLFAYAEETGGASPVAADAGNTGSRYVREFELGMPQMAIGALSESWLFKELGSAHWELLCRGLGARSRDLTDELGNRLYATFARVQLVGGATLAAFGESEMLRLTGEISRFGSGMYYSEFTLAAVADPAIRIDARLITSFSRRGETGNRDLVKSNPATAQNTIDNLAAPPPFIDEYRLIKKGNVSDLNLGSAAFRVTDGVLHESVYELNPYHDLNGVGLLYFAAYPIISDTCEARYFNGQARSTSRPWELDWATVSRDVMYYANCDITDSVLYRLHSVEHGPEQVRLSASLSRRSDGALMAKLFVVKARTPSDLV